jgi:hypothetical protein
MWMWEQANICFLDTWSLMRKFLYWFDRFHLCFPSYGLVALLELYIEYFFFSWT